MPMCSIKRGGKCYDFPQKVQLGKERGHKGVSSLFIQKEKVRFDKKLKVTFNNRHMRKNAQK